MFKRRIQTASLFQGNMRSKRSIVHGGQVWAFVILALILAVLTSPLWLISPPAFMGTNQEFRLAGAAFWAAVTALGLLAGRSWGLRLALDYDRRVVSREQCSPWKVKTLWRLSADQVSHVAFGVESGGIARLEVCLRDDSILLIEKGVNEPELLVLGRGLAGCWGVPLQSPDKSGRNGAAMSPSRVKTGPEIEAQP